MLIKEALKIFEALTKEEMLKRLVVNASNIPLEDINSVNGSALKTAYIASKEFMNDVSSSFIELLSNVNITSNKNNDILLDLKQYFALEADSTDLREQLAVLIKNRERNEALRIYNISNAFNIINAIKIFASKCNVKLSDNDLFGLSNIIGKSKSKNRGRWEVLLALLSPQGKLINGKGDISIDGKIIEIKGTKGRIANKNLVRGGVDVTRFVKDELNAYIDFLRRLSKKIIDKELFDTKYKELFEGNNLNMDNKRSNTLSKALIAFTKFILEKDISGKIKKDYVLKKLNTIYSNILAAHIMNILNRQKIVNAYIKTLETFEYYNLDEMFNRGDIYSDDNFNNLIRSLVAIDAREYKNIAGFDYLLMINDDSGKALCLSLEEENVEEILKNAGFKAITPRLMGNLNMQCCAWGLVLEN